MMLFYCFGNIKLSYIWAVNTGIGRIMGCTAVETHGARLTFGDGIQQRQTKGHRS